MSLLAVTSPSSGEGKTTVAVLLAYRLLALPGKGRTVLLLRAKEPTEEGERPAADATVLASVEGARAAPGPLDTTEAVQWDKKEGDNTVTIAEVPAQAAKDLLAKGQGRVVVAVAGLSDASLESAQSLARELGGQAAAVALRVPLNRLAEAPSALGDRGLDCLGVLAEDAMLAGPRVSEMARALDATYLYEDGDSDEVAEHLMIGPISSDPGQPYFGRHERKAVITRFDKTDVQLAALESPGLTCLILSGGQQPSPYILDRVQSEESPILLTRHGTVAAMRTLEDLYGATRLGGREKLERLRTLSKGLSGDKLSALLD